MRRPESRIGKKDCPFTVISLAEGLISPYNSKQGWRDATLLPAAPLARDDDAATAEIRDGRQGDAGQASGRRAPPGFRGDLWRVRAPCRRGAGGALLAMRHSLLPGAL